MTWVTSEWVRVGMAPEELSNYRVLNPGKTQGRRR